MLASGWPMVGQVVLPRSGHGRNWGPIMNISANLLLLVAQGAGCFLLASVVWLLHNRRIYVDADTKEPIEFDLPVIGKLKTQNPVIMLFLIGAGLVMGPVWLSNGELTPYKQATVEGEIETNKPVTVTVVPLPRFQATLQGSGPFKMLIPVMPEVNYRVWFSVDGRIATDQGFDLGPDGAKLAKFKYLGEPSAPPVVKKEVSDADLRAAGIY